MNALSIVPAQESSVFSIESIDCEETVVSYLLRSAKTESEHTDKIFSMLTGKDFGENPYRVSFEAMKALSGEGVPIEIASLKIRLEVSGLLADVGGVAALRLLAGGAVMATNISSESALAMANQVLERSRRRIAAMAGQELIKLAQDYTKDTAALIKKAEEIMLEMAMGGVANTEGETIGDLAIEALADIDLSRQAKLKNESIGITSCLIDLQNETGGYKPGELIVLAGRPGSGKSALAVNEAIGIAKQGYPVLMFSMEMKGVELATRVLGGESRIDLTRIRDGIVTQSDFIQLEQAAMVCQDLPLQVYAMPEISMEGIASTARRAKARAVHNELGAIVIDYLQLMDYDNNNEVAELGRISKAAKRLAMELECPVFLLSQLNRLCEARNDKRPIAADLKGSGNIEQDANLIVMVYRQAMYEPECQNKHVAELIIAKQRNGRRGKAIKVFYDEKTTTFRNLA
jgi:replicative DNA helicase